LGHGVEGITSGGRLRKKEVKYHWSRGKLKSIFFVVTRMQGEIMAVIHPVEIWHEAL
jgi:hypothetical protein